MDCTFDDGDNLALMRRLNAVAMRERLPLVGMVALTDRCNLRCVHCYARPRHGRVARDLPGTVWNRILGEAAEAGCLYLVLTGGEPLLHRDFEAIYLRAKQLGLLVSVYTNASLVTEAHARLWREWPPHLVEVSIYGSNPEVCRRVTGEAGAFEAMEAGLERLRAAGARVRAKTMILRENAADVGAIEAYARARGLGFRIDPALFPALADGDRAPLASRVPVERAVALEFASAERVADWRRYRARTTDATPGPALYGCGAGRTAWYATAAGELQSCMLVRDGAVSLRDNAFDSAWQSVVKSMRDLKLPADSACAGCRLAALCGYCPGYFALETGAADRPSAYLCALGHERARRLDERAGEGVDERERESTL